MKIKSNKRIPTIQRWEGVMYLIAYKQVEHEVTEENEGDKFVADMVISQSDSEPDIKEAIALFESDNNCFDDLINGNRTLKTK